MPSGGGLAWAASAARADEAYCIQLAETLETDPTTLGYGFTCWTIERLRAHLTQMTGITLSKDTLRKVRSTSRRMCIAAPNMI